MELDLTVHVAVPDRLLVLLERIAVALEASRAAETPGPSMRQSVEAAQAGLAQVGGTLGMTGVPDAVADAVARRRGIPVIWTEARRALLAAQLPYPAGPRVGQLREMLNALPGPPIATDKAVEVQRSYMRSRGLMPATARAVRPEAETVPPARPALQPIAETMPRDAAAPAPPRRVVSERLRLGAAEGQRGLGGADQAARETRPAIPPALATRDGAISTAALEQLRADPGEAVAMAWDDIIEWGRRWAPEVIKAGGRPMTVIAALNKHPAREGLPPMRLGKNLFGTHGALPSAGAAVGEKAIDLKPADVDAKVMAALRDVRDRGGVLPPDGGLARATGLSLDDVRAGLNRLREAGSIAILVHGTRREIRLEADGCLLRQGAAPFALAASA